MKNHQIIYLVILANWPLFCFGQQGAVVDKKDFSSVIEFEQILNGYLTELNGKYKIRVTKTTYNPGGYIGEHHHVGPGVRLVQSGELEYVQSDTTRIFREGDYFYESGDITHAAFNRTDKPVVILNFEILPADWHGASPVVPKQMKH